MSEQKTVRLSVIVHDGAMAAHLGGGVETRVRTFDLPREIESYIAKHLGEAYLSVQLGFEVFPHDKAALAPFTTGAGHE
jgi:hypothetical protein